MEEVSKGEALSLASRWEREGQSISVFCFNSPLACSLKSGWIAVCLDGWIEVRFVEEGMLRIFIAEARFSIISPEDLPAQSLSLIPNFHHGIRIYFTDDKEGECYLLA